MRRPFARRQREVAVDLAQLRIDQRRRAGLVAADEVGLAPAGGDLLEDHDRVPPRGPTLPRPPLRHNAPRSRQPQKVKLTFKEQREFESLPAEIEALEREQHELTAQMASADYHRQGGERIKADRQRAEELERLLESRFERWVALEEKAKLAAAG